MLALAFLEEVSNSLLWAKKFTFEMADSVFLLGKQKLEERSS